MKGILDAQHHRNPGCRRGFPRRPVPQAEEKARTCSGVRGELRQIAAYRDKMDMSDLNMTPGPWIQVAGSVYHGDSGSGLWNQDGELIGICSFIGFAPGEGFYSHLKTIRKFLK